MNWKELLASLPPIDESEPSARGDVEQRLAEGTVGPELLTLRILINRAVERARERRSVPHGRKF